MHIEQDKRIASLQNEPAPVPKRHGYNIGTTGKRRDGSGISSSEHKGEIPVKREAVIQPTQPPPSPVVVTEKTLPRATRSRPHIEQDKRITTLQDEPASVPRWHRVEIGSTSKRRDGDGRGSSKGREGILVKEDAAIKARVAELQAQVADMQEGLRSLPQTLRAVAVEKREGKREIAIRGDPVIHARVEELQAQVAYMQEEIRTLPQHLRSVVVEQTEGREEVVVQGDAAISARVEELQALVTDMQEGIKSLPQNLRSVVVEQSEGKEEITVKDDAVINARVEELQVQVADMQEEIRSLPENLRSVVVEQQQLAVQSLGDAPAQPQVPLQLDVDETTKLILGSIDDSVKRIEDQGERNAQGLTGIHAKVDAIMALHAAIHQAGTQGTDQMSSIIPEGAQIPTLPANVDMQPIVDKLDEVRAELKDELPLLATRLEALISEKLSAVSAKAGESSPLVGIGSGDGTITMSNIPVRAEKSDVEPSVAGISAEDVAVIRNKLDELLVAHQSMRDAAGQGESETEPTTDTSGKVGFHRCLSYPLSLTGIFPDRRDT